VAARSSVEINVEFKRRASRLSHDGFSDQRLIVTLGSDRDLERGISGLLRVASEEPMEKNPRLIGSALFLTCRRDPGTVADVIVLRSSSRSPKSLSGLGDDRSPVGETVSFIGDAR